MTSLRYLPSVIHGCTEADIYQIAELCFSKNFSLGVGKNIVKSLPPVETFFTTKWRAAGLDHIKEELNAVKSKLDFFDLNDWRALTARANHSGNVIRHIRSVINPELPTQAWCKFQAVVGEYPTMVPFDGTFHSLHLCEAPGAFIASLNHFILQKRPDLQWSWLASTLNPYYEGNPYSCMINDDRLILGTLEHWCFGEDNTGDIFSEDNLNSLICFAGRLGNIKLITADGSIDCQDDPGEQEVIVSRLHYAEVIATLHLLDEGGCLILKMFTCFEAPTVCLLYLLYCIFDEIHMLKPAPSKEGNSEVYLVCLGYTGKNNIRKELKKLREFHGKDTEFNMFSNDAIPFEFLNEVIMCARYFKDIQVSVILRNIELYQQDSTSSKAKEEWVAIEKIKKRVAALFVEKYEIEPIDSIDFLVPPSNMSNLVPLDRRFDFGSFTDKKNRSKESFECVQMVKSLLTTVKFKWTSERKFFIPQGEIRGFEQILSLKTGLRISRIYSSNFSSSNLLDVFNMLIDQTWYTSFFSKCFDNIDENAINISTFSWLDNFYHAMTNTYYIIKSRIEKMELGDNLTVLGLPLVSSFNVGLVYCLAYLFEHVILDKNYRLYFKSLRSKSLDLFDRIQECVERISSSQYVLLSLVPMSTLVHSSLYKAAVGVNHATLEAILRDYCESLVKRNAGIL